MTLMETVNRFSFSPISLLIVFLTIFLDSVAAQDNRNNGAGYEGTGYESLTPVDTIDGRRIITANGLQFEIPSYASGITDIQPPAFDLLPPFFDNGASSSDEVQPTNFETTTAEGPDPSVLRNSFEKALKTGDVYSQKYTGSFGGPEGVLTPVMTSASSRAGVRSRLSTTAATFTPAAAGTKYTGSFGGPPGVLVPYDDRAPPANSHQ